MNEASSNSQTHTVMNFGEVRSLYYSSLEKRPCFFPKEKQMDLRVGVRLRCNGHIASIFQNSPRLEQSVQVSSQVESVRISILSWERESSSRERDHLSGTTGSFTERR